MTTRGMVLAGITVPSFQSADGVRAEVVDDRQHVTTYMEPSFYETIIVEQGTLVDWTIIAKPGTLNGCNNPIIIPHGEVGQEKRLSEGENTVTFMPEEAGVFTYRCWMGMIRGEIIVEERELNS